MLPQHIFLASVKEQSSCYGVCSSLRVKKPYKITRLTEHSTISKQVQEAFQIRVVRKSCLFLPFITSSDTSTIFSTSAVTILTSTSVKSPSNLILLLLLCISPE